MSFGNKVLGFGAFPTRGDYEIDQSLVFDSAGGPYLHRTPGSASNQRTWTFSAWIKGNFTDSYVFGAYDNSSGNDANYGLIWFEGNALNYQGWSTKYRVTNKSCLLYNYFVILFTNSLLISNCLTTCLNLFSILLIFNISSDFGFFSK